MKTIHSGSSFFKAKILYYYIFLLLSWVILIYPLLDTKLIPGHDYVFHVTRILDVAEAIKAGIFPVRIYVDEVQFWGSPAGVFYPSLFNYIPVLLKLAGLPIEICYNFYIALIFLLGIFSSWYGFSILTRSKIVGFFSTILYLSSGYYLIDAYIRNALGELLGLSFMPLAMACIGCFITKEKISGKICIFGIVSISAIIQSHVLSSCFLVLFGVFQLLLHNTNISKYKICRLFLVVLALFLLNANFIIPFLFFYKNVPVSIDFIDTFSQSAWPVSVTIRFLFLWSFWLLTALMFFFYDMIHKLNMILSQKINKGYYSSQHLFILSKVYALYFLSGLLFLFMSTSAFPWDDLPVLQNIFKMMQFPLRFLGIATLCFCVCGGFAIRIAMRNIKLNNCSLVLSAFVICMTGLITLHTFAPVSSTSYWKVPSKIFWERMLSSTDDDYLYKDMDVMKLSKQGNRYISDADISNYQKNISNISFSYRTKTDTKIILPLVNYPCYVASDQSGRKIKIEENDNHMITIPLTHGSGIVKVWYKGLLIFKIADYLSLISVLAFLCFMIKFCRENNIKIKNDGFL